MAALSRKEIDVFYTIIRKNNYSNVDTIYYHCLAEGLFIKKEKLGEYIERLKKEDVIRARRDALLRQKKIKKLLNHIRQKETLLLNELNKVNIKLNTQNFQQI